MFSGIVERTAEVVAIRTDRQNKDLPCVRISARS